MRQPFEKELLIRLTGYSLCTMFICNFGYFPFWFQGRDFGSNCIRPWSLFTFMFLIIGVIPDVWFCHGSTHLYYFHFVQMQI